MTNQINRKSFILYKDSLDILDKLSDEQAGKLFKAIHFYQKKQEIPALDFALDLVFTSFLNQFKRDDESYKTTCEARKLAGSKGGKQKVANASNCKQKVANLADSENDNENESKNDNVNKNVNHNHNSKTQEISKSENKPTGYNSLNLEKTPNLTPKKPQDNPKITPNENDNLDFQEFWDHYTPVECNGRVVGKDSKKTAEEKYKRIRTQHNHDVIMLKLKQYLTYCKKNSILTKAVHRWLTTTDFSDTEQEQAIIADRPFAIASKQDIQQQQNHQAFANFLSKQKD
jgi:hypothetical protein